MIYAESRMELRQLRYLEAVARHGHFTRAADELHVAQSAVSHQVRRLEQELGVELLERTTRSVKLTAAGRVAVARARAALAEADGLSGEIDELRGLVRGTIAIGALLPAGPLDLPALLAEFNRRYPGIEIEFREGTAADMTAHLDRGELDAAFVLESAPQPPELGRLPLSEAEMVLAMSPAHPLAAKSPLPIERLDGENLIAFRRGSSVRHALDQALERVGSAAADRARGIRPPPDPGARRPGLRGRGPAALVRGARRAAALDPPAAAGDQAAGRAALARGGARTPPPPARSSTSSRESVNRRLNSGRSLHYFAGSDDANPTPASTQPARSAGSAIAGGSTTTMPFAGRPVSRTARVFSSSSASAPRRARGGRSGPRRGSRRPCCRPPSRRCRRTSCARSGRRGA